MFLNKIININT